MWVSQFWKVMDKRSATNFGFFHCYFPCYIKETDLNAINRLVRMGRSIYCEFITAISYKHKKTLVLYTKIAAISYINGFIGGPMV